MRARVAIHRQANPTDLKSRAGNGPGTPVDPPQTPGQDGAGVIDAVGQGVDAGLVGAPVWLWEAAWQRRTGTAAEYTTLPVRQAVVLPDGVAFDVGASLGIPFVTAHRCLTVSGHGPRRPGALQGHTVLVTGGAGAVGNAAIQLARRSDARVIATVSSAEKALTYATLPPSGEKRGQVGNASSRRTTAHESPEAPAHSMSSCLAPST